MVLILTGNRDSKRDEESNARAVARAEQERSKMLTAIHAGDPDRASEHSERAEQYVKECYERAMDRAQNLERNGDPRGELARANQQLVERARRGDPRYRR